MGMPDGWAAKCRRPCMLELGSSAPPEHSSSVWHMSGPKCEDCLGFHGPQTSGHRIGGPDISPTISTRRALCSLAEPLRHQAKVRTAPGEEASSCCKRVQQHRWSAGGITAAQTQLDRHALLLQNGVAGQVIRETSLSAQMLLRPHSVTPWVELPVRVSDK